VRLTHTKKRTEREKAYLCPGEVQVKCCWDEVVDEVKSYKVVILRRILYNYNVMMKAIDHRRSDQGAMDGHYHHEQAR